MYLTIQILTALLAAHFYLGQWVLLKSRCSRLPTKTTDKNKNCSPNSLLKVCFNEEKLSRETVKMPLKFVDSTICSILVVGIPVQWAVAGEWIEDEQNFLNRCRKKSQFRHLKRTNGDP